MIRADRQIDLLPVVIRTRVIFRAGGLTAPAVPGVTTSIPAPTLRSSRAGTLANLLRHGPLHGSSLRLNRRRPMVPTPKNNAPNPTSHGRSAGVPVLARRGRRYGRRPGVAGERRSARRRLSRSAPGWSCWAGWWWSSWSLNRRGSECDRDRERRQIDTVRRVVCRERHRFGRRVAHRRTLPSPLSSVVPLTAVTVELPPAADSVTVFPLRQTVAVVEPDRHRWTSLSRPPARCSGWRSPSSRRPRREERADCRTSPPLRH